MNGIDPCDTCDRPMRPMGALKQEYPGTLGRSTKTTCNVCYSHNRFHTLHPLPDTACVLVRVYLKPATYIAFSRLAKYRQVDVAVVLAEFADRSVAGSKAVAS